MPPVGDTIENLDLPGERNALQDPVGGGDGAAAVADHDLQTETGSGSGIVGTSGLLSGSGLETGERLG